MLTKQSETNRQAQATEQQADRAAIEQGPFLTREICQQIEAYLPHYPIKQAILLPALHIVQERYRCVPLGAIEEIAELLELAPAEVHDTMSFYGFFRTPESRLGTHRAWVCRSISCAIRGSEELLEYLCQKLEIRPGETTSDGRITLEFAECLGGCDFAPCLLIDGQLHKNLTTEAIDALVDSLVASSKGDRKAEIPAEPTINIEHGTSQER